MNIDYKHKYLKYKRKYRALQGGMPYFFGTRTTTTTTTTTPLTFEQKLCKKVDKLADIYMEQYWVKVNYELKGTQWKNRFGSVFKKWFLTNKLQNDDWKNKTITEKHMENVNTMPQSFNQIVIDLKSFTNNLKKHFEAGEVYKDNKEFYDRTPVVTKLYQAGVFKNYHFSDNNKWWEFDCKN
jgi:hypothetical protein